jgi:DNA polymerase III alpha subunit (gram-positive type)
MSDVTNFLKKTEDQIFYVVDTKTDGYFPATSGAIEVAVLRVLNDRGNFKLIGSCDYYINPNRPLSENISVLFEKTNIAITDSKLKKAPSADKVANELKTFFVRKDPYVVGYDIPLNLRYLGKLYNGIGEDFTVQGTIDVKKVFGKKIPKPCALSDIQGITDKKFSKEVPEKRTALSDCFAILDVLDYAKDMEEKGQLKKINPFEKEFAL